MVGIFGGYLIAIFSLNLSSAAFLNRAIHSLVVGDLLYNLNKSAVFGFIIVTIGAYFGLRVSGGASRGSSPIMASGCRQANPWPGSTAPSWA